MSDMTQQQPERHRDGAESPVWVSALLLGTLALLIIGMSVNRTAKINPQWITVLGVIATLGIFSILYKENPLFRYCEHIFIGLATGYGVVITWFQFILPKWYIPMLPKTLLNKPAEQMVGGGQWWFFLAFLLGLMFFSVYFPKIAWMNRFMISVMMGFFAGTMFQVFMGMVAPQITASFRPPITANYSPTVAGDMNNYHIGHFYFHPWWLISVVVLICTFAYFFFSVEHRSKFIRQPAVAGRYFLMISLGAIFGTTVMGRLSLLIARLDFLRDAFTGWWHLLFH